MNCMIYSAGNVNIRWPHSSVANLTLLYHYLNERKIFSDVSESRSVKYYVLTTSVMLRILQPVWERCEK